MSMRIVHERVSRVRNDIFVYVNGKKLMFNKQKSFLGGLVPYQNYSCALIGLLLTTMASQIW